MKSLIRWGTTLSLVGGVLFSSLLSGNLQALALTSEQVVERLRPVPVFTLTDGQGAPLVASPNEGEQGSPVAGVFISQQDAQSFLENLRRNNPDLARDVQVVPVSLGEVYQLSQTARQQQENLEFAYVPMQQQVASALTILQQTDHAAQRFEGVPLFIARSSGQQGGYLTIQQGEQQVIPMFFKQEELQAMLDRLRQQQPDLAARMSIQVVNLEGLIQTLETSENPELNQILLIPPHESIEFVRSLQSEQGQPQPTAPSTPSPSPTPSP